MPRIKLTGPMRDEIKQMRKQGVRLTEIAASFGVAIPTVYNVLNPNRRLRPSQRRSRVDETKFFNEHKCENWITG